MNIERNETNSLSFTNRKYICYRKLKHHSAAPLSSTAHTIPSFIHKIQAVFAETLQKRDQFLLNVHITFVSLQGMDSMRPTQPVNSSRFFHSKICPGSFNFSLYGKPDSYTAKPFGYSSQTA